MGMTSIIVPVYNTAQYLERCLDSILKSTYRDFEVICIDDGSEDQSPDILKRYADRDLRIRIITQSNQGVSAARNAGLNAAQGDYVTFIDSDDCIHPDYLKCLMTALIDASCDIAGCQLYNFKEDAELQKVVASEADVAYDIYDLSAILQDSFLKSFGAGKIYRREILEGKRFRKDVILGEDVLFIQDILFSHQKIRMAVLKEKLCFYYVREDSATRSVNTDIWIQLIRCYMKRYDAGNTSLEKSFYLEELAKRYSFIRYYIYPYKPGTVTDEYMKGLEKEILRLLRRDHSLKLMKKLSYFILTAFPQTYRRFRKVRRSKWFKRLLHYRRK